FVLQTHTYLFPKPRISMAFKLVVGNGLVFAEGEEHKQQRKLLAPAFAYSHIKRFLPIFVQKTAKVLTKFDSLVEGGPTVFEIFPYFSRVTLDAIGEAAFGVDLSSVDDEDSELVRAYNIIATSGDQHALFYANAFVPFFKDIPIKYNRDIKNARKIFRQTCKKVLQQHQEESRREKEMLAKSEDTVQKNRDILSLMLSGGEWTVDQIENQIMTFLFAGHETTAGSLSWSLLQLAKSQDVQEKLRTEVRKSFPGGFSDIQSAEQIESLKYLNNVANECFRFLPPVITTAREASEDIVFEGETIVKGTMLHIAIKAMCLNKKYWGEDADEFKPDRWNGQHAENAYANITFLQGTRSCIGRRFAELEFKAMLASFVGRYKFEESVPNQPSKMEFVVTVRPLDGIPLKVSRVEGW
ncbi:cytochrome P450, partial [Lipomyces arxii]|uniref:cytochrome P450 n=1 Tax=Lipomyces arxii TaxID=56418 RepID=UPI0034CFD668